MVVYDRGESVGFLVGPQLLRLWGGGVSVSINQWHEVLQDVHRTSSNNHVMAPMNVLMWSPCPSGRGAARACLL